MKQFDLYRLQTVPEGVPGGVDVVKRGFSWPGLLFAGVWALSKHLWLIGIVLIVVRNSREALATAAAEDGGIAQALAASATGRRVSTGGLIISGVLFLSTI